MNNLTCPRCNVPADYGGALGYEGLNCLACMTHYDLNSDGKEWLDIPREPVESSDVKSIGLAGACMEVEYLRNGKYRFYNVSRPDYLHILNAESVGTALRRMIAKRKWLYEKQTTEVSK